MAFLSNRCILALLYAFSISFLPTHFASSTFLSDGIFESHGFTSRSLLQQLKKCPENLENWNYTVITSKCKGPHYTAKVCCDALKELACPHADLLNDLTTDCSVTMFSYINLYGKYPPGLFANECKEDMDGLNCPEAPPPSPSTNGGQMLSTESSMLMVMAGLGLLLIHL